MNAMMAKNGSQQAQSRIPSVLYTYALPQANAARGRTKLY